MFRRAILLQICQQKLPLVTFTLKNGFLAGAIMHSFNLAAHEKRVFHTSYL
jgi:hypothetical protein